MSKQNFEKSLDIIHLIFKVTNGTYVELMFRATSDTYVELRSRLTSGTYMKLARIVASKIYMKLTPRVMVDAYMELIFGVASDIYMKMVPRTEGDMEVASIVASHMRMVSIVESRMEIVRRIARDMKMVPRVANNMKMVRGYMCMEAMFAEAIDAKKILFSLCQFISLNEINNVLKHVCRYFNNGIKTLKYGDGFVRISESSPYFENVRNSILPKTKTIRLSGITNAQKLWKILNACNNRNICLKECNFKEGMSLPKKIETLRVYIDFYDLSIKNIIDSLKFSQIKKLEVWLFPAFLTVSNLISSGLDREIIKIFESNIESIYLRDDFGHEVSKDSVKSLMSNKQIKTLELYRIDFPPYPKNVMVDVKIDTPIPSLTVFLKLSELSLKKCNIAASYIIAMITPSLKKLALNLMPNIVNDWFVETLSEMKRDNYLNLTTLELESSNITSKCIVFLNLLDLRSLSIANCKKIDNLNGLNLRYLKKMNINGCIFNDDAIIDLLKNSGRFLVELNVTPNENLTEQTLKNICAFHILLKELSWTTNNKNFQNLKKKIISSETSSLSITKVTPVHNGFELLFRSNSLA